MDITTLFADDSSISWSYFTISNYLELNHGANQINYASIWGKQSFYPVKEICKLFC